MYGLITSLSTKFVFNYTKSQNLFLTLINYNFIKNIYIKIAKIYTLNNKKNRVHCAIHMTDKAYITRILTAITVKNDNKEYK